MSLGEAPPYWLCICYQDFQQESSVSVQHSNFQAGKEDVLMLAVVVEEVGSLYNQHLQAAWMVEQTRVHHCLQVA